MMNDDKHIESLLNLFMQGETSLEQERELSKYFSRSTSVPEEWKAYRDMFAYFDKGIPIDTKPKRTTRLLWVIAAAAVAATAIMVVPHLRHSYNAERTIKSQSIIADKGSKTINDTIVKPMQQQQAIPLLAKQERKTSKKKTNVAVMHCTPPDSIEIEREKGEVEQAQQELMADKFIIEQERQEVLDEQYYSRAQAYQAQQALQNENPQFIQVLFK